MEQIEPCDELFAQVFKPLQRFDDLLLDPLSAGLGTLAADAAFARRSALQECEQHRCAIRRFSQGKINQAVTAMKARSDSGGGKVDNLTHDQRPHVEIMTPAARLVTIIAIAPTI